MLLHGFSASTKAVQYAVCGIDRRRRTYICDVALVGGQVQHHEIRIRRVVDSPSYSTASASAAAAAEAVAEAEAPHRIIEMMRRADDERRKADREAEDARILANRDAEDQRRQADRAAEDARIRADRAAQDLRGKT